MKKVLILLAGVFIIAGCCNNTATYEAGMFDDVMEYDYTRNAVEFCVNKGYMTYDVGHFDINGSVTLSECADIIVKITGADCKNSMDYVVKEKIAPCDFDEWDAPASRENVAYMFNRAVEEEYINNVIEGSVSDVSTSYAREAVYNMYRRGIFSGDRENNCFRPFDNITRSEMAVVIYRTCNKDKRVSFDMSSLSVSFVAFGDTIGHMPVVNSGKTVDGYDFTGLFENVKMYVDNADVACVNQETVFVNSGFSGYPSFGSPEEIGKAEAEAGFDVVTHATNHAFDRGVGGVLYTAEFWEKYETVTMLGIHQDEADAHKIEVLEKNGIRIAMLNYTYSLNGYRMPKGKEYLVDLLDEEKIKADMERARNISDAIVVFAHWGNEYQNTPSKEQRAWAQLFADEGATVIVGHHPHVVQPLEIVESCDGRSVPVYYSLGNFISNQEDYQNALCAMADFKIVKDTTGTGCADAQIKPVMTHMQSGYYSAYLLSDYSEELAQKHKKRAKYGDRFSVEKYTEVFNNIVN